MAKIGIDTGSSANDGTGDTLRAGAGVINHNFNEIYNTYGDGTNLTSIAGTFKSNSLGIHTLRNVGLGTSTSTSILTVLGNVDINGITTITQLGVIGVTTTQHLNVTGVITSSNITGTSATITSALVGSGVTINNTGLDAGIGVGIVTAKEFYGDGSNLSGIATLPSRVVVSGASTSIGIGSTAKFNIAGYKSYNLFKVGITSAAWVRIYTDAASRDSDITTRQEQTDPTPGSGVIAEVATSTAGFSTFIMSPGVIGWNNDPVSVASSIFVAVTNKEAAAGVTTVNLTVLQLED
jgi:hypothetical protein|tara:strand:+ start:1399 stop:2280 length:882 start_codon:yes stop_codon:yes gene_type:complete